MNYGERVRHPTGAFNPPRKMDWFWVVAGLLLAFILVAIFRPRWFDRIGIHANLSDAAAGGAVSNPMEWIG